MNAARLHLPPPLSWTGVQKAWRLLRSCHEGLAEGGGLAGLDQAHPAAGRGDTTPHRVNPAARRGNLATIRGNLTAFRGNPAACRGNPAAFRGSLTAFRGNPATFRGNLTAFRGNLTAFRGSLTARWEQRTENREPFYIPGGGLV